MPNLEASWIHNTARVRPPTLRRHPRPCLHFNRRFYGFPAAIILAGGVSGCGRLPAVETQKPVLAVKVENAVKESDLATVILAPKAEERLGIRTVAVESRVVSRTRTFGGEVVLPPDQSVTLAAPVAGKLLSAAPGTNLTAGSYVKKGQAVFRLLPLLAPERDLLVKAEQEVAQGETRYEAAKLRAQRADQLLRDQAGSRRALEQAQEELALADTALKTARERLDRVRRAPLEADNSVELRAPRDGMLAKIYAGSGDIVAGSAPLFDLVGLGLVWVRVPVYVGDLASIYRGQPARVHGLAENAGAGGREARPIAAPPSADPNAATADLYFELSNDGETLRPGQRVGVTLVLHGTEASLVVPWSAILHDIHGGDWVYENTAPQHYVRRRVELARVVDSLAVLARGPAVGAKVVTAGAAELFGTEFGAGK